MQSSESRNIQEMYRENGRKLVSGLSAVKKGAGTNPWMETPDGVLILPAEAAAGSAMLKDSSARHLPEFYPADPEEAFRMARSAVDELRKQGVKIGLPKEYLEVSGLDPEVKRITDEAIAKNGAVNAFLKQGLDERPTYEESIAKLKQAVS